MIESKTEITECVGTIIERDNNYVLECLEFPFNYYWTPESAPEWIKPGVGVRMKVTVKFVKETASEPIS